MKKILVLSADYPDAEGRGNLRYVHTRNKCYIQHGIDVTVLNFYTVENYMLDGIKVISLKSYKRNPGKYDTLILHAANIRNHYKFLIKYENRFPHILFFFHGHEVLKLNEVYPKPYDYVKKSKYWKDIAQEIYDIFKLFIWRKYLPKIAVKADFIFVSEWFYHEFEKYVKMTRSDLLNHVHIINNSVGEVFEENNYHYCGSKKYDFITIRSMLDGSKYCIDLVTELAKKYSQYSFLVIGCGDYYKFNMKTDNITLIEKNLNHQEILQYLDQSRCGLLPTRLDAQGVMTCEFATYGIPVITSDIEVCREICGELYNVALIDNDVKKIDLEKIYTNLLLKVKENKKNDKFCYNNTVKREEAIIKGEK